MIGKKSLENWKYQVYFYLDGEYVEDRKEFGRNRIESEHVEEELLNRISTCMKLAELTTNLDIAVAIIKDESSKVITREA